MPSLRHKSNVYLGDVLHPHRYAVGLGEHHILDVVDLVPFGQVVVPAVVDQPDAPDIDRLLADGDLTPANIDVGIAERGHHLRNRDAVGFHLGRDRPRHRIPWSCRPSY